MVLIEHIPDTILFTLTEISLLVVGIFAEKHYISRMTSFTNGTALVVYVASRSETTIWLDLYAEFGIVVGAIGLLSYISEKSLNAYYYDVSGLLYSSVNVAFIILVGHLSFWLALIAGVVVEILIFSIWNDRNLIHRGEFSGSVKRFHEKHNFEFKSPGGIERYDFSDWFN